MYIKLQVMEGIAYFYSNCVEFKPLIHCLNLFHEELLYPLYD